MATITRWDGCYREGWQEGDITAPSFAHPAKVAKGLAFRIIRHLITQGYVQAGQTVLDPFCGIGGFCLPALSYGLRFWGVELEEKFVRLSQDNFDLWHRRYGFTGGTVVQGDSRQLRQVLAGAEAACCVGSPPFVGSLAGEPRHDQSVLGQMQRGDNRTAGGAFGQSLAQQYGSSPGQLGALPPGTPPASPGTPPACVVSSPPYAESAVSALDATSASGGQGNAYRRTGKSPRARKAMVNEQYNAAAVVSSPPYSGAGQVLGTHNGIDYSKVQGSGKDATPARVASGEGYGVTPGQLGNMPTAIVSSPPYAATHNLGGDQASHPGMKWADGEREDRGTINRSNFRGTDYGHSAGQLGAMPAGAVVSSPLEPEDVSACISSPPYAGIMHDTRQSSGAIRSKAHHTRHSTGYHWGTTVQGDGAAAYGTTPGQLGAMPAGAVVSSPPWEKSLPTGDGLLDPTIRYDNMVRRGERTPSVQDRANQVAQFAKHQAQSYGSSPEQLGNTTGDTFWSAADAVMREVAALLPVGGIACWVLKGYVSKGRLVDFPAQWLALCERHGFRLVEEIHASLIEESGVQETLFGEAEKVQTERKSFFRRLHEKRPGAVRIDHETVLVCRKL